MRHCCTFFPLPVGFVEDRFKTFFFGLEIIVNEVNPVNHLFKPFFFLGKNGFIIVSAV